MKYFMSVLGLVTIVCIIAGTYMHVGGGLSFFDKPIISLGSGSDKSSEGKDISFSENYENVNKLDINMAFGDVTIIEGSDLNVNFEGHSDLKPEVKVEDGKLEIKQKKNIKVKALDFNKYKSELTVTIPSSAELDEVETELDMGDCKIKDFSCKKLKADMSMGNLEIKDVTAETIEADNDMGDCKIFDSYFDRLKGNCDMGNIHVELSDDTDNYGITAKVDMGEVKIDGNHEGNSYSSKGDKTIELKVAMGDISVE
ncbi:MAG: DUF4097 domain-containing protein [Butyrivibrio sp.]|nr:DUF4097 domain-containing protein [Butyrivibrio sp.]